MTTVVIVVCWGELKPGTNTENMIIHDTVILSDLCRSQKGNHSDQCRDNPGNGRYWHTRWDVNSDCHDQNNHQCWSYLQLSTDQDQDQTVLSRYGSLMNCISPIETFHLYYQNQIRFHKCHCWWDPWAQFISFLLYFFFIYCINHVSSWTHLGFIFHTCICISSTQTGHYLSLEITSMLHKINNSNMILNLWVR